MSKFRRYNLEQRTKEIWRNRTNTQWCQDRLQELAILNITLKNRNLDALQISYYTYLRALENQYSECEAFHLATRFYRDIAKYYEKRQQRKRFK